MARKTKDGKWIDATGEAIPAKYISKVDKKRDRLVMSLTKKAQELSEKIRSFKECAMESVNEYLDWLSKENGLTAHTKKGNKLLYDFSRDFKVEIKVAERIDFDERLQVAREVIGECIKKWSKNADDKIKLLVEDAFKVDKQGRVDKNRILGLTKLDIKDKDWKKAMTLIKDSIQVVGQKPYIRFWRRTGKDTWEVIPLDITGV